MKITHLAAVDIPVLRPYGAAKSVSAPTFPSAVQTVSPSGAASGFAVPSADAGAFVAYAKQVRAVVDDALPTFLEARRDAFGANAGGGALVADAFSALALRGGKRLRAALVALAFEATRELESTQAEGSLEPSTIAIVQPALIAIELLQSYLLAHDDWMDQDDVRRGGPSCHAWLRSRTKNDHEAAVGAVLAGDLGVSLAQRALLSANVPASNLVAAARIFAEMQEKVVQGQSLDVFSQGDGSAARRIRELKTTSYTVEGPLLLGVALARGESAPLFAAFAAFAEPVGDAFQMRDDVLALFGDPAQTGKPRGNDLREGKWTDVVTDLSADPAFEEPLRKVLGNRAATAAEVDELLEKIASSGAVARVNAKIQARAAEAYVALEQLPIAPRFKQLLKGAIESLVFREA